MILQGIQALIQQDATIGPLVGARVYRSRLPQGSTLPAIRYSQVAGTNEPTFETHGIRRIRVQFDVYSNDPLALDEIKEALFEALDGFNGELPNGDVVTDCQQMNDMDDPQDKPVEWWAALRYEFLFS